MTDSAAPAVTRLEWDSAFFGFEIGRLDRSGTDAELAAAVHDADAAGIDCSYLLLPGTDAFGLAAAQDHGYRVVDVRVVLERSLDATAAERDGGTRPAAEEDRNWVLDLARRRFDHSRFVADASFGPNAAAELFARWAERGFGDPERTVHVLDDAAGFVVTSRTGKTGSIELITAAEHAPKGAGSRLLDGAHRAFLVAGCDAVDVVTQATNVPALRLYERCGYRVTRSSYWLHRWRPDRTDRLPRGR